MSVVVQFLLWNNLFLNWDKIVSTQVQNSFNWYNFNCTGEKNSENILIYVKHREHTSFITVVCHAFTKFKRLLK